MLKQLNVCIKNLEGTDLSDGGKPMTMGVVFVNALLSMYEDEKDLTPMEKVARYKLAQRVFPCAEVDLTVEDLALLKKVVGKCYGALVVGQVFEFLDG